MTVPLKSQPKPNLTLLVKVYCLKQGGKWVVRGTGKLTTDYTEQSKELGLYVTVKADNATLLSHRISNECDYKKQDLVISWRDTVNLTEFALKFSETAACNCVWDHISKVQGFQSLNFLNSDTFRNVIADVKLSTLPQILQIVTESGRTHQTWLTELILKDDLNFFQNLMNVFDICEESKNVDDLHMVFNIVKRIILLNSPQILDKILGDDMIMKIIGCLEYDPDVPQHQHHRNYLKEHVVFKEAMPIKDPMVLSRIHQTYRIGYLKDVILARVLDDATANSLKSVINLNEANVVILLSNDDTFFPELFTRIRSPSTSVESRTNLVQFLHEFCSLSKKSLDEAEQRGLFRNFMYGGILGIIADILQSPDKKLVLTGADILLTFLTYRPNLLLSDVAALETSLFGLLVKGMMEDYGDTVDCPFLDIFRILIDRKAVKRAKIMNNLCVRPELVDFITASCPQSPCNTSEDASRRTSSHCGTKPQVLLNICELMCICLRQNSFRTIFLDTNVMEKVLLLTRRKEPSVVAAAIRVFRTLLSVRDENVQIYVVKNNLMKPLIDVLVANGDRDNLVVSAILELLKHIHKRNATVLVKYVVDTFSDQLTPFKDLISRPDVQTTRCEGLIDEEVDKDDEDDEDEEDEDDDDDDDDDEDDEDEEDKDESAVKNMDMD